MSVPVSVGKIGRGWRRIGVFCVLFGRLTLTEASSGRLAADMIKTMMVVTVLPTK